MSTPFQQAIQNPHFKRRAIRMDVNPLDKSTVISILPKPIKEVKPTIQPGVFEIASGSYEKPALLVVGSSSWWRDVDPQEPLLEIPVHSVLIADSICKDYCNGYVGCDMSEAMPGLFFIPSKEITVAQLMKDYKGELDKAKRRQDNWFRILVNIGDAYWARTNGNPISITDDMRLAAKELGLDRQWIKDFKAAEMVRCFACGNMKNQNYPVCPTCKVVDMQHPLSAGLKFSA